MFKSTFQNSFQNPFSKEGATAFSPLDLNPLAWWDFSDIGTLFQDDTATVPVASNGDPVGHVTDKSVNGNNLSQSSAGNRPSYSENIQNGLSALSMPASGYLVRSDGLGLTGNPALSVFISGYIVNAITQRALFTLKTYPQTGMLVITVEGAGYGYRHFNGARLFENASNASFSVLDFNFPNGGTYGDEDLFQNGAAQAITGGANPGNQLTLDDSITSIGAVSSNSATSLVGSILVFGAQLSTEDRGSVFDYLNTKWSVY